MLCHENIIGILWIPFKCAIIVWMNVGCACCLYHVHNPETWKNNFDWKTFQIVRFVPFFFSLPIFLFLFIYSSIYVSFGDGKYLENHTIRIHLLWMCLIKLVHVKMHRTNNKKNGEKRAWKMYCICPYEVQMLFHPPPILCSIYRLLSFSLTLATFSVYCITLVVEKFLE